MFLIVRALFISHRGGTALGSGRGGEPLLGCELSSLLLCNGPNSSRRFELSSCAAILMGLATRMRMSITGKQGTSGSEDLAVSHPVDLGASLHLSKPQGLQL